MRYIAVAVAAIALSTQVSQLSAQTSNETIASERQAGFAHVVSAALDQMKGKWTIKSATLKGVDLPLDQFNLLTVDNDGFTLNIQDEERRFELTEFKRKSETFVAKCSAIDYPEGLTYEISVSKDLIKIRYRTDGAHIAPAPSAKDDQLLVQIWNKSKTK